MALCPGGDGDDLFSASALVTLESFTETAVTIVSLPMAMSRAHDLRRCCNDSLTISGAANTVTYELEAALIQSKLVVQLITHNLR